MLLAPIERDEARRRWGLLRVHAGVLRQEAWLRRSMWVLALDALKHPRASTASSSQSLISSFFFGDERTDSGSDCGSDCRLGAEDDESSVAPRDSALQTCVTAYGSAEQPVGGFRAGMKEVLSQLDNRQVERTRSTSETVDRREDSFPAFQACGECAASSCAVPLVEKGLVARRVAALTAQGVR